MKTFANPWIRRLFLLGLLFLLISGWSFYRAAVGVSPVIDHDYYSHGLRYNDTQIEQRAATALGWQLDVRLAEEPAGLLLTLRDRAGEPVTAASGTLTLRPAAGSPSTILPLTEIRPGDYAVAFSSALAAGREALVSFERAGVRLQRPLLLGQ